MFDLAAYSRAIVPPLSLLGLVISLYVWRKQKSGRPIACWTRDCDRVIRSPYSRLLGVHNSAVGVFVFLAIFLATLLDQANLASPASALPLFPLLVSLSSLGALVSLYLTYVQLFVLKGICNWCLTSALLIFAILILTLAG